MATARWTLRLPQTLLSTSPGGGFESIARGGIRTIDKRRWFRKPATRGRPRTSKAGQGESVKAGAGVYNQKEIEKYEAYLRRTMGEGAPKQIHEGGRQAQVHHQGQQAPLQQPAQAPDQTTTGRNTQLAATLAQSDTADLVTEVRIPDDPNGVLPPQHPALTLLGNSSLVIQRQMEMMNIMLGFEQANKYIIMDGEGQTIGYIAEQDHGMGSMFKRQLFATHRSFTTHIFDKYEREVLRVHRPFAWINSRIRIYDPVPEGGYADMESSTALQGTSVSSITNQGAVAQISPLQLNEMRIIGEAQQQWAPLRRKYNLFSYRPLEPSLDTDSAPRIESGKASTSDTKAVTVTESQTNDAAIEAGMVQFAHVNEPFLSWDFILRNTEQIPIGSVNRNFAGFAREIFTDTGVYALRMDSAAQQSTLETAIGQGVGNYEREATAMTLDQRAVMLAIAVSIDFDYFSRHSHAGSGGGMLPFMIPMGGGTAEAGAVGGAVGAAEGAGPVEGAAGAAGRGIGSAAGVGEGAIAGAGSMAGYEAMNRGIHGPRGDIDVAADAQSPPQNENVPGNDSIWGESQHPWGSGDEGVGPGDDPPSSTGGEDGGGGSWFDSFFEE